MTTLIVAAHKMKELALIVSAFLLFACQSKTLEKVQQEQPVAEAPDTLIVEEKPDPLPQPSINTEGPDDVDDFYTLFEFEKTSCYGHCPAFQVEILSNGYAVYHGVAFVDKIGKYETWVNNSFIFFINQKAENTGFFDMAQKYPTDGTDIPDLPKTIIYLNTGEKEHRVINSFDAPPAFRQFEKFLLEKLDELYWEKMDEED